MHPHHSGTVPHHIRPSIRYEILSSVLGFKFIKYYYNIILQYFNLIIIFMEMVIITIRGNILVVHAIDGITNFHFM